MRIEIHHRYDDEKLDGVLRLLRLVLRKEMTMSQELDDLTAKVAEVATVEGSAVALITGIAAQLTELEAELAASGVDTAKLAQLTADLKAATDPLAAAVAANTPAEPPAP
jgi:hypothetical protein